MQCNADARMEVRHIATPSDLTHVGSSKPCQTAQTRKTSEHAQFWQQWLILVECSIWTWKQSFVCQRAISNCRQYCFGLLGLISAVYIYIFLFVCFFCFCCCCCFGFKFSKINSAIFIFFYCLFVSTGPLLNDDMSVGCMPHEQYKDLTFSLSGKELGRLPHTHLFILVATFDWIPRLSSLDSENDSRKNSDLNNIWFCRCASRSYSG